MCVCACVCACVCVRVCACFVCLHNAMTGTTQYLRKLPAKWLSLPEHVHLRVGFLSVGLITPPPPHTHTHTHNLASTLPNTHRNKDMFYTEYVHTERPVQSLHSSFIFPIQMKHTKRRERTTPGSIPRFHSVHRVYQSARVHVGQCACVGLSRVVGGAYQALG